MGGHKGRWRRKSPQFAGKKWFLSLPDGTAGRVVVESVDAPTPLYCCTVRCTVACLHPLRYQTATDASPGFHGEKTTSQPLRYHCHPPERIVNPYYVETLANKP